MSGHGFHVHGPHDHEVEHVAQHGGDSFTSRLAVLTAVLSTIGAIFGYMGGHSQNAALLLKNEAAIQKTSASNQWNYYQAKSNKQNLAELSITLTSGEAQEKYKQEVERYKQEKTEIKAEADKLEVLAKEAEYALAFRYARVSVGDQDQWSADLRRVDTFMERTLNGTSDKKRQR